MKHAEFGPIAPAQAAVTQWEVMLDNGSYLQFSGSLQENGRNRATLIDDFKKFSEDGTKPRQPRTYLFNQDESESGAPMSRVTIDVSRIAAIMEKPRC